MSVTELLPCEGKGLCQQGRYTTMGISYRIHSLAPVFGIRIKPQNIDTFNQDSYPQRSMLADAKILYNLGRGLHNLPVLAVVGILSTTFCAKISRKVACWRGHHNGRKS